MGQHHRVLQLSAISISPAAQTNTLSDALRAWNPICSVRCILGSPHRGNESKSGCWLRIRSPQRHLANARPSMCRGWLGSFVGMRNEQSFHSPCLGSGPRASNGGTADGEASPTSWPKHCNRSPKLSRPAPSSAQHVARLCRSPSKRIATIMPESCAGSVSNASASCGLCWCWTACRS